MTGLFKKSYKNTRTKNRTSHSGCPAFAYAKGLEPSNAKVRWTFAKRRLDGVYRKPCQRFGLGVPPGALSCPAKKLRKNAAQGAIATGNRFQKPKWSSIPSQCAHWHGMGWS